MSWSSASRRHVAPVAAGALLLLAGCSDDGSRPSSADGPARSSAAPAPSSPGTGTVTASPTPPPTATPTVTAAPAPVADCVDTSAFNPTRLRDYLVDLPGDTSGVKALHVDEYGVWFRPAVDHRACRALYVNVSQFWVTVTSNTSTVRRTPGVGRATDADYLYEYEPIGTTAVTLTLGVGNVPGSAPPEPTACKGTLTVVHLGEAITDAELPDTLTFEPSLTGYGKGVSSITLKPDRVLAAGLVSPTGGTGC